MFSLKLRPFSICQFNKGGLGDKNLKQGLFKQC